MFKQERTYHYFSRAILVLLCPVFFSVQILFNFGVSGNTGVPNNYFFGARTVEQQHPVKACPGTAHHQTGFRLNKHFQPESLPSYDLLVIERPLEYLDCHQQAPYAIRFFSSPLLKTQSLRGPPRVYDFS